MSTPEDDINALAPFFLAGVTNFVSGLVQPTRCPTDKSRHFCYIFIHQTAKEEWSENSFEPHCAECLSARTNIMRRSHCNFVPLIDFHSNAHECVRLEMQGHVKSCAFHCIPKFNFGEPWAAHSHTVKQSSTDMGFSLTRPILRNRGNRWLMWCQFVFGRFSRENFSDFQLSERTSVQPQGSQPSTG